MKLSRIFILFILAALIALGTVTSCDSDGEITSPGTVSMMLTGSAASGNVYRLRDANFALNGQASLVLSSEDDPDSAAINETVAIGDYTAELLTGWRLERIEEGGAAADVEAELVSDNPVEFEIFPGVQTKVTFVFRTGEGDVTLDEGEVSIDIEVEENCTGDEDCDGDLRCIDGICQEVETSCVSDSDCLNGYLCLDGICQEPGIDCSDDSECTDGYLCIDAICQEPSNICSDNGDCPNGYVCDAGICAIPDNTCVSDADCPAGQVCDPNLILCVEDVECSDGADCGVGDWSCNSNMCDCSGLICGTVECIVGGECCLNTDCSWPLSNCVDNQCSF